MWLTKKEAIEAIEDMDGDKFCPECLHACSVSEDGEIYCPNEMCLYEERTSAFSPHPLTEIDVFVLPEERDEQE